MTDAVFDAASVSTATANGPNITWTHTPVGTPTGIGIGVGHGFNNVTVTGVTYGGQACALEATIGGGGGGGTAYRASLWSLANPPAGAQTVVATFSANDYGAAYSVSVTGGDTADVFDVPATSFANTASPTVVPVSAANQLVMDIMVFAGSPPTPGTGQTGRASIGTATTTVRGSTEVAAGASTTMDWACGAAGTWPICGACFKAGSGGGGGGGNTLGFGQFIQVTP